MSTDPAHSLADSFDVALASRAQEIAPNLWAEQIDAQERLEENWRDIQEFVVPFLNWAGVDAIEAEELSVIPGLDEIFALTDVKTHVDSGGTTCSWWTARRPPRPCACCRCPRS